MKARIVQLIAASAAVVALCSGAATAGNTWWVDVNGQAPGTGTLADPYTSIHYAVQQPTTLDGDLILVEPGTYVEMVEIVHKYVTVRSTAGPLQTTIHADGQGTVLTVIGSPSEEGTVTVEGFKLIGGTGTWRGSVKTGGGILAEEVELYLNHIILRENQATLGGGLAADAATVHMYDCVVEDNSAETEWFAADGKGGGILVRSNGRVVMNEVLVKENQAGVGGGIYAQDSGLEVEASQVKGNLAWGATFDGLTAQGGGVFALESEVAVHGSEFHENAAFGPEAMGGGLRFGPGGAIDLRSSWITQNEAGNWGVDSEEFPTAGGGIASDEVLFAYDLEIRGNQAEIGGGVFGAGAYDDCHLGWNVARLGGGAYTGEGYPLVFTKSVIRENQALPGEFEAAGGGLYGPALVDESRIFENLAIGNGGGAYKAILTNCEIFGNYVQAMAYPDVARGGGVFGGRVESSILRDNYAEGMDGGIAKGGGASDVILVMTQIYDNQAHYGGGAHNSLLDRCTVFGNAGLGGAGVYFDNQGYMTSSIVWGNLGMQLLDVYGVTVEWSNVEGGWIGQGNMDVDPKFWNVANRNFHLRPGSPCIDHGDPTVNDPDGTRCDQGALPYELGIHVIPTVKRSPATGLVLQQ
jgi:hypothetical protein